MRSSCLNASVRRLTGLLASSLFSKIGIKNGDVVSSVNEVSVVGGLSGLRTFQSLNVAERFVVELIRGGETLRIPNEVN